MDTIPIFFHLIPTPTDTKEKTKCTTSFLVLPCYRFKILTELNKITVFIGDVFLTYFKKQASLNIQFGHKGK